MHPLTYLIIFVVLAVLVKKKVLPTIKGNYSYTLMVFITTLVVALFFEYCIIDPLKIYLNKEGIPFSAVFLLVVVALVYATWKVKK